MILRPLLPLLAAAFLSSSALAASPAPSDPAAVNPDMQAPPPPAAPDLSEQAINTADFAGYEARLRAKADAEKTADAPAADPVAATIDDDAAEGAKDGPDPFLIRMQVLLDRAHASPGVVDGRDGGNTTKAVKSFADLRDGKGSGAIDAAFWEALSADGAPAVKPYAITEDDLKQEYIGTVPEDYAKLAKLDCACYRDAVEMLAERFHMDEDLLRAMNPQADFGKAGTTILVADPGPDPDPAVKVAHIVVDKDRGELFAYGEDGKLVVAYPATIGSSDTPSPSGRMKVNGSAKNPKYEYDPKNFVQGKNRKELTLPPGPNGPVGNVWIDLSKPTYGIHGTPEPSKIDKTNSHGCVRLTNWDAQALARLVQPQKTTVEFKG
jgi:lipoprotein-anchoring transpeptidase ErfK/SrfK